MQLKETMDVLSKLKDTSGKNDKLQLLKYNSSNNMLADILDAVFNTRRIFHIKKFNESPTPKTYMGEDLFVDFMNLLSDLEGGLRGNKAKDAVEEFLSFCDPTHTKWFARIIRKDIKCGFSAKTAVKAGFTDIPVFDVMLAKDGKGCKKLEEIVKKGVWVSPKLDGYRCLTVVDDGVVTLLSRNGTEYHNFPTIVKSLEICFPTGKYIFDGEIMSDDFQAMQMTAFSNKSHKSVGDVGYHIFGYIDYDEWMSQDFKMLTRERMAELKAVSTYFDDNLNKVNQQYTESLEDIYGLQANWEMLGFEGAMALPDIPYYLGKKSNRLLKFKSMETQDSVITGMYEGKPDTRLEGKMGGVVVRQENGKECECGSGWSDQDREIMWANPEFYVGQIIETKYQELTKKGIMRFPVFIRWRNDK